MSINAATVELKAAKSIYTGWHVRIFYILKSVSSIYIYIYRTFYSFLLFITVWNLGNWALESGLIKYRPLSLFRTSLLWKGGVYPQNILLSNLLAKLISRISHLASLSEKILVVSYLSLNFPFKNFISRSCRTRTTW